MTNVRTVTADDLPMVKHWAFQRGLMLDETLLTPHGFMAEESGRPALVVWAYLILDVPVIQLDHLCSVPGLSMQSLRAAWSAILQCVKEWVKIINSTSGLNYNVLRCFCDRRMLGEAAKDGWTITSNEFFQIVKRTD